MCYQGLTNIFVFHFFYINDCHKSGKNLIFQKSLTSHETNLTLWFLSFSLPWPKPKQNHQIACSRAKTKSRQSQACEKYRGIIICIKRNTDVNTGNQKILHKKCPNKVDFPDVIFNFSKFYMVCLQSNAWLESCDRHGSFGTKISGSLIVSPVLWVLSSRNTLSVTHSDTASYEIHKFIKIP